MGYLAGGRTPPSDCADRRVMANPRHAIRALPLAARVLEQLEAGQYGDATLNLATQAVALAPSTPAFQARLTRVQEARSNAAPLRWRAARARRSWKATARP